MSALLSVVRSGDFLPFGTLPKRWVQDGAFIARRGQTGVVWSLLRLPSTILFLSAYRKFVPVFGT